MYDYRNLGGDIAYENARQIGDNLSYYGFNLDFAPVADVWSNPGNTVIGKRAYSNIYSEAAELIPYAVRGFHAGGVLCTLKHFPGHGNTKEDSHYGNAYVYINNQGYILEISDEKAKLPVLKGYKTDEKDIVVGQRLCNEDLEMLSTVLKIMEVAQSEEIFDKITGIDIRNKSDYEIEMENEQKTAHLGDCSMLEERILWVKTILNETKDLQGEIFVNMNLNSDRPFFRERV